MAEYDTGWPWPLDAVQEWFEDLLQSIWDGLAWVAKQVWNVLPYGVRVALEFLYELAWKIGAGVLEFFRDPVGAIESGLGWVRDQVNSKIAEVKKIVDGLVAALWDALPNEIKDALKWLDKLTTRVIENFVEFVKDPVKAIKGIVDDIKEKLKPVIDPISEALGDVKEYFTKKFQDFMKDPLGSIKGITDDLGAGVKTMFDGAFASVAEAFKAGLVGLAETFKPVLEWMWGSLLTMIGATKATSSPAVYVYYDPQASTKNIFAGWIYEGIKGFWEWLMKSLTWIGQMIVGAVDAIVSAVQEGVGSLFRGLVDVITGAFQRSSPDPQISKAVDVMVQSNWTRQVEIITKMYKSPPSIEDVENAGYAIAGGLITSAMLAFIGGAAVDIAHPFKEVMASRTVREVMWMVGVPAVTASIITLPTAIGLLTPLRYALNEKWQPMQPGAADIIRFAVRECFVPERLPALLERYPAEPYSKAMAREGYSSEWAKMFWGAHWVLPSLETLNTYLYRHDEFREMWRKYVVYHDYIPESVSWLEEIIYPPWTRVDVRRMWEVGVITEDVLTMNYRWLGYDQVHAELLTLWTKIWVALPDLKARYRNGWISAEDMKAEIVAMGMPAERADLLMQTIIPAPREERTSNERDLTKTDVLALFKIGQITPNQTKDLLMGLGYDEVEAEYLIAIQMDKLEVELKELSTSQILKAYRYEIFTREQTKSKLMEAGWSDTAAETLLKLEDVKLADSKVERMRERDLTPSQMIRGLRLAIIDLPTCKSYLAYLGYSDWEIDFLLKLEGFA